MRLGRKDIKSLSLAVTLRRLATDIHSQAPSMLAHPMPVLESAIKQIGSRSMAASPRATTVGREASNRQEYPFRADGREADPEAPPRKRPNKRWSALGRQPSGGARVLDAPSAGAGIIQGGNQSVSLDEVLRSGHPMSLLD